MSFNKNVNYILDIVFIILFNNLPPEFKILALEFTSGLMSWEVCCEYSYFLNT